MWTAFFFGSSVSFHSSWLPKNPASELKEDFCQNIHNTALSWPLLDEEAEQTKPAEIQNNEQNESGSEEYGKEQENYESSQAEPQRQPPHSKGRPCSQQLQHLFPFVRLRTQER